MGFELKLDDVLTVYRDAFGSGSLLLLDFIRKVEPAKDGTLATSSDGILYYNPEWCEQWITDPNRLKDGLLHEIGHPVMGDFAREPGWLSNFAGDAVINAFLFNNMLSTCDLMKAFYAGTEQEGLLRSASRLKDPALHPLYKRLYPGNTPYPGSPLPSTPEVIEALAVLLPHDRRDQDTVFIGTHGCPLGTPTETHNGTPIAIPKSLPQDVVANIGEAIIKKAKENAAAQGAGWSDQLEGMMIGVLHSTQRIQESVLKKYAFDSKKDKIRDYFDEVVMMQSVVPTSMSRSAAVAMALGYDPVFYRTPVQVPTETHKGIYVYVDVSGSAWGDLPRVLGVLNSLTDLVVRVYQFSNFVHESSMQDLAEGKIHTTGGTDFDCIIKHAVENKASKVLIFSDGCADASEEMRKLAIDNIEKMALVYFGGKWTENWIHTQYDETYDLDDITQ